MTIVTYLIIAAVLSLLGQPFVKLFNKIKIGKFSISPALSALLSIFTLLLILFSFIALFIPLIIEEAKILSSINTQQVLTALQEPLQYVEKVFDKYYSTAGADLSFKTYLQNKLISLLSFTQLTSILNALINATGDFFVAVFSIAFITFFFLKDKQLIYNSVLFITPVKYEIAVKNIMTHSKKMLTKYFMGICIESAAVITLVFIGLSILGIKHALIIAFFVGIMNIIPYVGPLIGGAIGIIIGVSTHLDFNDFYSVILPLIGKMALVFTISQLIDNMILQPIIFSNVVKSHPLEIFLVILVGGNIAGVTGILLAIPVYTIIRVIAKEILNHFNSLKSASESGGD